MFLYLYFVVIKLLFPPPTKKGTSVASKMHLAKWQGRNWRRRRVWRIVCRVSSGWETRIERCARLYPTRTLRRKKDEAEKAVPLASKTSKQPGSFPGTGARQGLGVDHGGGDVLFVKGGDGGAVHEHLQEDSIEKREEGLNKPVIRRRWDGSSWSVDDGLC